MTPDRVKQAAESEIRAGYFPGAVLLCGTSQSILYHEAFGWSRVVPEETPMQRDTVFDVASVTKAVATTTALAACVDDGLLQVQDKVGTYLPAFQNEGKEKITIAQLAYHASGLDNTMFDAYIGESFFEAVLNAPAAHAPDTVFCYSCRGYVLMGLLVEAVTGKRFAEVCSERIFDPLGMKDTGFQPPQDLSRMAGTERKFLGEVSDNQARAAGRPIGNAGMFTTATDLAIFAQMMLHGGQPKGKDKDKDKDKDQRIISEAMHKRLTSCASPPHLPARSFGWDMRVVEESPARGRYLSSRTYGHTGWTGQSLWIDPERDFFLIVLTNRTHPKYCNDDDASAVARGRIADALVESFALPA